MSQFRDAFIHYPKQNPHWGTISIFRGLRTYVLGLYTKEIQVADTVFTLVKGAHVRFVRYGGGGGEIWGSLKPVEGFLINRIDNQQLLY